MKAVVVVVNDVVEDLCLILSFVLSLKMVKDGKLFKAKKRKGTQDVRNLKAALSAMPKPVHPKRGNQGPPKNGKVVPDEDTSTPPVEIQFAQKLASNDPVMRNRAVKKLNKWLEARSLTDADGFNELEMMRLWKGLHYCFWMSDKPLIQEELAESIGSMVNSFGSNESAALLFASCFMATLAREWIGLDRWRMDKFMMLVRRVLRHCFVFLAKFGWKEDLVAKWSEICEKQVVSANSLNQTVTKKKKKRRKKQFENEENKTETENGTVDASGNLSADPTPDSNEAAPSLRAGHRASLGFQLHFVDIFLEELAKIGGEDLPAETIHSLMTPFIAELARGDDNRLSQHIEERIFHHLMRQSDVGIAYEEESSDEDDDMDEDNDVIGDEGDEITEQNGDVNGDLDDEDFEMDETVKDPRAGKVDVVLPQLQPDYEKLAEIVFQAGSGQNVPKNRRDRLYRLTKQLKALANGIYPLAMELSEDEEELPKKINVAKVAKKAAEEEFRQMVKAREDKKKFQLEIKEQQKAATQVPPVEQEVKLLDESENEDSESEEDETVVQQEKKKVKRDATGRRIHRKKNERKDTTKGETPQIELTSPKPASPREKKNKNKKEPTNGKVHKTEELPSPIKKLKTTEELQAIEVTKEKKKKDKKNKTQSNGDDSTEKIQAVVLPKAETTQKKPAENKPTKLADPVPNVKSTPPKSKKKKNKSEQSPVPSSPLILSLTPEQKDQIKKAKISNDATSTPITDSSVKKKLKKLPEMSAATAMILNVVSEPKSNKKNKKAAAKEEENEQVITISKKSAKKRKNSEDEDFGRKKKSATPMQRLVASELLTNSLPNKNSAAMKKKRINFSLMENKCSSLQDIDKSILDSPEIPFHADKKPKQGVLKKTSLDSSVNTTPTGGKADKQSVAYNTLLNGRSTFKKRRAFASDFF